MGAGDAYIAALIATAILVAPFNALARVIVVTWAIGHAAYLLGVPELRVNLVQHMAAMIVGARYLRTTPCVMAYVIFASLIVVDGFRLLEPGMSAMGWWTVLLLSLLQLSLLPFGIEWKQVQALRAGGLRAYWAARPRNYLRVGA